LKNKRLKNKQNFRQFKSKMFMQTIMIILLSVASVYFLYLFFLKGNFANWMVFLFQKIFQLDYEEALMLFKRTLRDNMDFFFIAAMVLVFFITFRIYLNWFTKYFMEINRGIDSIVRENTEDVTLSPVLLETEKQINTIKHTIEKQKMDLQLAEQGKNDLIVYLAHDLKTPLASVIGYLNLLNDEKQISEELREKYIAITLDKAERLEDLINEFFEIARFNLSNITLQYSKINLSLLLQQLVYEFNPILKEKNLRCCLDMKDQLFIRCDADKIQRVFDNLLRNAYFYSFNDTNIIITAFENNQNLIIRFINYGDAISKENLELIFEQFYRLNSSRDTKNGGAGLGLAIARKIVELHHGTITAKSENEQIEFEIMLPKNL